MTKQVLVRFFPGFFVVSAALAPAAVSQDAPAPGTIFADCAECPSMIMLEDGNAMAAYLVQQGEFARFAAEAEIPPDESCFVRLDKRWKNEKGKGWRDPGFPQEENHPVVCVNWLEATAYADWLSEKSGKSYRLPTYEESVAATAAGAETGFWWGEDFSEVCLRANAADVQYRVAFPDDPRKMVDCDDGYAFTSPVTAFPPNGLGLYDMAGNVWQWTNSCVKGDCSNAIFRGASWAVPNPKHFRTDGQWFDRIILRNSAVGFRVMRDPE